MVIVVDGLAASGAYITALAGDHIVAKQTSLVGSIGVLFQFPNVTDLLEQDRRQGRDDQIVAAQGGAERLRADQSRRRARPSKRIIKDSYAWFKGLVQDRRHLNDEELQRSTTAASSPAIRASA